MYDDYYENNEEYFENPDFSIDIIKKDITSFFYDESKEHWIYKYRNNRDANVDGKKVFYLTQLKVLFEDHYFHWKTGKALEELVKDGVLINWKEKIDTGIRGKKITVSLFRKSDVRYYLQNTKKIIEHIKYNDDTLNKAVGNYAELLTKFMFLELGFKIIGRNTNEFEGKKWKLTDHDLDFIVSKDQRTYGVEVKNTLDYIPRKEFQIKMFKICPFLGILPMCVFRFAPKFYINELNKTGGFGFVFKRKVFPYGQESKIQQIWNDTLLPIEVSDNLSEKNKKNFLKWHDEKVSEL